MAPVTSVDLIPRVPLPCMSLSPPPAGPLASASLYRVLMGKVLQDFTLQDSGGLEDIWGVPSGDLGLYSRKQVPYSLGLSVPVNSVMSEAPTRSDISDPLNYWATGSGSWCPEPGWVRAWERCSEGRPPSSFGLGNSLERRGARS